MTILYALVSVGKTVLAEYTATSGKPLRLAFAVPLRRKAARAFAVGPTTRVNPVSFAKQILISLFSGSSDR